MSVVDRIRELFLVRQFQRGSADAFLSLVRRYERRLLYFLKRFERDPERALDVLQEVWMTAWCTRASLRNANAFRTWIYRIAHGKIVGTIRDELRRRETEHLATEPISSTSDELESAVEAAEVVHAALQKISPEHREVLTLRFLEEMPIADIAEVTKLPIGTVKSRLHYASREILSVIEEQNDAKQ